MTTEFTEGDEIVYEPGSTHQETFEVVAVEDGDVTLKLVDQAVGYTYATEDVRHTVDADRLAENVEDGVFQGNILKKPPEWDRQVDL